MSRAFRTAHRAIDAHDPDALAAVLDAKPGVVREHGRGNANTLLGMAAATCDDRLVDLLLAAGADPLGANVHGWTPLHQVGYANAVHLVDRLLAAGARTDVSARGDGGTPLVCALFWGHRDVADRLVAAGGVAPANLRAAAGMGNLDAGDGGAHRAFYRPHSGFPEWTPRDDPQEVLDEALAYAARNDRAGTVATLIDRGADTEADVYRGTPLVWAASTGAAAAVAALLDRGADPDGRSTYGGPDHGKQVTPLHLAATPAVARALLDAGADPSVVDGHGYGAPEGWARHDGRDDVAAVIAQAA